MSDQNLMTNVSETLSWKNIARGQIPAQDKPHNEHLIESYGFTKCTSRTDGYTDHTSVTFIAVAGIVPAGLAH